MKMCIRDSSDAERNLLCLLVDVNDLSVNYLTFGENLIRLADSSVSDLGNVDKTVNSRNDLSKSAERHKLDDRCV